MYPCMPLRICFPYEIKSHIAQMAMLGQLNLQIENFGCYQSARIEELGNTEIKISPSNGQH